MLLPINIHTTRVRNTGTLEQIITNGSLMHTHSSSTHISRQCQQHDSHGTILLRVIDFSINLTLISFIKLVRVIHHAVMHFDLLSECSWLFIRFQSTPRFKSRKNVFLLLLILYVVVLLLKTSKKNIFTFYCSTTRLRPLRIVRGRDA